jgi:lysyl endopeptidase
MYLCSGALINNTSGDLTPYFLTAHHCGVTAATAATVVVYWNYQNCPCRTPGSAASGGAGNGSLGQFQTGSTVRADYASTDVTLLELDDPIAAAVNAHWAGWDRTGADASSAVGIHHPGGEEKRISFENDPTTVTSYYGTAVPGDGTHIRVTDWDLGTTEGGSSGSPLFNPDHRIIGQLHGGDAACGNNEDDWYGRFSVSWTGGGTNSTRLSNWLDPGSTGVTVLDGIDGGVSPVDVHFIVDLSGSFYDDLPVFKASPRNTLFPSSLKC